MIGCSFAGAPSQGGDGDGDTDAGLGGDDKPLCWSAFHAANACMLGGAETWPTLSENTY